MTFIMTSEQIEQILQMPENGSLNVLLDLGKKPCRIVKTKNNITVNNAVFPLRIFSSVRPEHDALYLLDEEYQDLEKIQLFSKETNQYYRLVNCGSKTPPTVEISGIKMHVTMDQDPYIDTRNKLDTLSRLHGKILDTCCGLGYTAIAAARNPAVNLVTTVEIDENMQLMCKINPYSQELYDDPKIALIMADSAQLVFALKSNSFNFIFHDPPRYALAPELYTVSFYRELHRVLTGKGELYHYTGNPNKAGRRKSLAVTTAERLREAGFSQVKQVYQGVKAVK